MKMIEEIYPLKICLIINRYLENNYKKNTFKLPWEEETDKKSNEFDDFLEATKNIPKECSVGVPYFAGEEPKDYFYKSWKKGHEKCGKRACYENGVYSCTKRQCQLNFCIDHINHLHLLCSYVYNNGYGCKSFCETYFDDGTVSGVVCKMHYTVCYNEWVERENWKRTIGQCITCKKYFAKNTLSGGQFCYTCGGLWADCKRRGIPGAFGSGR